MTKLNNWIVWAINTLLFSYVLCDSGNWNLQDGSGETIFFSVFILFFGAVFTLFGYALIKILVVIFGFIFCATVTYISLERLTSLDWYWSALIAIVPGIIGMIVFYCAYVLALFALGFCGGLVLGLVFVGYISGIVSPDTAAATWWIIVTWAIAIFSGAVIGIITVKLERILIIIVTAVLGSFCVVGALDYLIGDGSLPAIIKDLINQTQPDISQPVLYVVFVSWGVLAIFGIAVQFLLPMCKKRKSRSSGASYYGGNNQAPQVVVIKT